MTGTNNNPNGVKDYRLNPADAMKKASSGSIATEILNSMLSGGAGGAAGGLPGILAGAGVGLAKTGIEAIMGAGDRADARKEAQGDWSAYWGKASTAGAQQYKSGGKIKGAGSAKSDSIGMEAPKGSFVVPTENAPAAMKFGKDYLGWGDKEIASKNYGNIDINVSNGEVFYTPEEYKALQYYGVDVDELAPDAEKNNTGFFRCGGGVGKLRHMADGGNVDGDKVFKNKGGYEIVDPAIMKALDFSPEERKVYEATQLTPYEAIPSERAFHALGMARKFIKENPKYTKDQWETYVKDNDIDTSWQSMDAQLSSIFNGKPMDPKRILKHWEKEPIGKSLGLGFSGTYERNKHVAERKKNTVMRRAGVDAISGASNPSYAKGTPPGGVQDPKDPDQQSMLDEILGYAGELAGAAQIVGGTTGLIKAGRRPDVNVSEALRRLSKETRDAAGYGLPPAVKNSLKADQAKAFNQAIKNISERGGSSQDIYNETMGALSLRLSEGRKTELADYQAKEAKVDRNIGIEKLLAGQEFDIDKINLSSWQQDQDVWASLLSAGVNNIIGSRQYKAEAEAMKAAGDGSVNLTVPGGTGKETPVTETTIETNPEN